MNNKKMSFITVYCPDCRGRFDADISDFDEGDVLECSLCMAEVEILQMDPLKIQLFCED